MVHICIPNAEWDVNMGIWLLYLIDFCSVTWLYLYLLHVSMFHSIWFQNSKTLSLGVTVQKGRGDVKETRLLLLSRTVSEWIALFLAIQFLSHTVQVKSVSSTHYDLLIASYVKAHLLYFISHFICNQIFRMEVSIETFHWKFPLETYALSLLLSASKDSRCVVRGKN